MKTIGKKEPVLKLCPLCDRSPEAKALRVGRCRLCDGRGWIELKIEVPISLYELNSSKPRKKKAVKKSKKGRKKS